MRIAESGIEELEQFVDTLIIIPNQNLFRIANDKTTFADAFKMADDVLQSGVRGVTDLMVVPGLINLDFADVRAVMSEMGKAMMGTGQAEGERRALDAAEAAICNPLLEDVSLKGARGVLINITGSPDIALFEVDEAVNRIRSEVDPDAFIIFGSTFDADMEGRIRVSVVATGMDAAAVAKQPTSKLTFANGRQEASEEPVARSGGITRLTGADLLAQQGLHGSSAGRNGQSDNPSVPHGEPETVDPAKSDPTPALGNVFIPPAPASRTTVSRRTVDPATRTPQGAEPHNGGALGRVGHLFARVTGSARGRSDRPEPGAEGTNAGKTAGPSRLGGMSADERLPSSRNEEDLLDIPAFLRRQAN
jgi:cell division protein FtsZ